ncbi:MAG: PH domain-containing protein [Ancalomicrobiaceae bacterium]|nr:PH domain-containing protein [Ancalomicrobiaceae bacterium]
MSYIESVLQPGEKLAHVGRIHPIIYLNGVLLVVVGLVVLFDAFLTHQIFGRIATFDMVEKPLAYLIIVVGLFLILRAWFRKWTTEIGVTDRRVIQKTGFISRRTAEMNINQVERVEVRQTILGRIFNYGSLSIHGTGAGLEGLETIADPLSLRTAITAR